jgi:hypothetical protein
MDDKIFKQDAKSIVDLAFNNKLFKEEITRDDMNTFEELNCKPVTFDEMKALTQI